MPIPKPVITHEAVSKMYNRLPKPPLYWEHNLSHGIEASKNWRVYHGSCLEVLPKLGKYDFIFSDPPYNIGQEYQEFEDHIPEGEYSIFTTRWIKECLDHLTPDGVLCLFGSDNVTELYLQVMRQQTRREITRIAWINWHYRFGQCNFNNWIDCRCHCLIYSSGNHVWNPQDVLVPSDRATTYGDKRVNETKRGGMRLPFTIWGLPSDGPNWGRVTGSHSNKERRPSSPNQLPEKLMERLIRAYTNTGSKLLDPFMGSATTCTVAKALNRSCDTIEISLESCKSGVERIKKGAVRI